MFEIKIWLILCVIHFLQPFLLTFFKGATISEVDCISILSTALSDSEGFFLLWSQRRHVWLPSLIIFCYSGKLSLFVAEILWHSCQTALNLQMMSSRFFCLFVCFLLHGRCYFWIWEINLPFHFGHPVWKSEASVTLLVPQSWTAHLTEADTDLHRKAHQRKWARSGSSLRTPMGRSLSTPLPVMLNLYINYHEWIHMTLSLPWLHFFYRGQWCMDWY